jgi:sialate O-acetylesterase
VISLRSTGACLLAALSALAARADVTCAGLFTDHLVLQRDQPVPIWGTAQPWERITVEFAGQHVSGSAGKDGRWRIRLNPIRASAAPRALVVRGHNRLEFADVLVGDVWFCSGESNMEKPLGPRSGQKPTDHYQEEIRAANHPLLRLYLMPHFGKPDGKTAGLHWLACTPEAVRQTQFSAAAYYFGRELTQRLNLPVGLILSSFGESRIEAWMPANAFDRDPRLAALATVHYAADVPGIQATELYQSMIAPLAPYPVRGFLWYQGEANCRCAEGDIYAVKLQALIASWRAAWNEPAAPFYYVQLAPFDYSRWNKFPRLVTPEELPLFRDAQTRVLAAVPHTGQVITTDLVTNTHDIHPTDKREVGLRLAALALEATYARHEVVGHSPQFGSMHGLGSGQLQLTFIHAGQGLHWSAPETADDFSIAGSDRHFVPAHGEVSGDQVTLSAPSVAAPVAVRFGWNEVAKPHLFNSSGLPVVPFRTDDWPVAAERARKKP